MLFNIFSDDRDLGRHGMKCLGHGGVQIEQVFRRAGQKMLPESVNPMPVDDEIVAAIHRLEQKDGVIRQKPLEKNDQIRVAHGPMKDVLGVFDHWSSDQGRVRVLLNFINYQASVELHHSLVEKVA